MPPGKQNLTIADFTAPDSGTFAIPDSIASGSLNSHHRSPHWHGVRVTTYDNVSVWQNEEYTASNSFPDEDVVVIQGVKFYCQTRILSPSMIYWNPTVRQWQCGARRVASVPFKWLDW